MLKSLLLVLALGATIGLLMPTRKADPTGRSVPPSQIPQAAISYHVQTEPLETRLQRDPSGHFYADALVNGQPLHLVVDTGATTVALTLADAERIGVGFSPAEFTVIGAGASGPVRGQVITLNSVSVGSREVANVRGAVVEGLNVSLLGQTYLSRIGSVHMSGDEMVLR